MPDEFSASDFLDGLRSWFSATRLALDQHIPSMRRDDVSKIRLSIHNARENTIAVLTFHRHLQILLIVKGFEELSSEFKQCTLMKLNDTAPIHRLPNEILRDVFELVVWIPLIRISALNQRKSRLPFKGMHRLASLTRVCKKWSHLAHRCPSLWTHPVSTFPNLPSQVDIFWSRSDELPFSVALDSRKVNTEHERAAISESLSRCYSRLQRLDLFFNGGALDIVSGCVSAAPHLKVLTLSSLHKTSVAQRMERRLAPNFPSLPLKALAFSHFLWLPSDLLPALTHVHLSAPLQLPPLFAESLLRFLLNAPQIEFLHFERFKADDVTPTSTPGPDLVPLRRLRSLVFTHCDTPFLIILNYLRMQTDCLVRAKHIQVTRGFPSLSETSVAERIDSLGVSFQGNRRVYFLAEGPLSGVWLQFPDVYFGGQADFMKNLHEFYPLAHITSFTFTQFAEHGKHAPYLDTISCLVHMPSLTTLQLRFYGVCRVFTGGRPQSTTVIERLCTYLSGPAEDRSAPLPCPILRNLRLLWSCIRDDYMDILGEAVQSMLEARAERGAAMTSLVIQPGQAEPELVSERLLEKIKACFSDRLRECVEHLEVISPDKPIPLADPMRDMWRVEDEEMYWTLDDYHRASQDGNDV